MTTEELFAQAKRWAERDPDKDTAAELLQLIDAKAAEELSSRFMGPLEFGTAGLRGIVGAGETRMNQAVIATTTEALADVLEAKLPNAKQQGVVIGHDARRKSEVFALLTAKILRNRGFTVWLFDDFAPTPLVAFAARANHAAAAIVITASHNPPEYNGYKVYWNNGAQIIPPVDDWVRDAALKHTNAKAIADRVAHVTDVAAAPESWREDYLQGALALRRQASLRLDQVRVAYSPMHGVGGRTFVQLLERAGVTQLASVPEQFLPDGAFPTVRFPNPEEPGAMDLLLALGRRFEADVAIANDPDADRLAVAVREGAGFRQLSGNEVGTLLGAYLLSHHQGEKKPLLAASIVSSPELSTLCKLRGVRYADTLTGFKWIANTAMQLERSEDVAFIFGYEEALGYSVGQLVRDKDGISAALLFVEMVAWLKQAGRTVADYQRDIAKEVGVFASMQKSINLKGDVKAAIAAFMKPLRESPPKVLAGDAVVQVRDFLSPPAGFVPSDMIALDLASGARLLARPSGTEPKVKIYCDVRMAYGEDVAAVRAQGIEKAKALIAALG